MLGMTGDTLVGRAGGGAVDGVVSPPELSPSRANDVSRSFHCVWDVPLSTRAVGPDPCQSLAHRT